jgi:predicted PurR-regulated permease PerM
MLSTLVCKLLLLLIIIIIIIFFSVFVFILFIDKLNDFSNNNKSYNPGDDLKSNKNKTKEDIEKGKEEKKLNIQNLKDEFEKNFEESGNSTFENISKLISFLRRTTNVYSSIYYLLLRLGYGVGNIRKYDDCPRFGTTKITCQKSESF